MQISSYINWKNILGFSAAFYLGTYLHLRGGIAEAPILLAGLLAMVAGIIQLRGKLLEGLSRNERWFVAALFLFGAWSAFTVWLNDGAPSFYESPARFIVGSLIAIPILKNRIDIRWVQLGAAISTVLLIYLVLTTYNGGRFAPTMNATKWGNAIAFHALLCAALGVVSIRLELKIFFTLAAIFGIYSTAITGTRGAIFVIVVGLAYLSALSVRSTKGWITISAGILILLVLSPQIPIVKSRLSTTQYEISRILSDDFNGSIGQRLTMWAAGAQAGLRSPLLGEGYDFPKTMNSFLAPSDGLAMAAARVAKAHSNHHSAYIDTLARTGFVGLVLLLALLYAAAGRSGRQQLALTASPVIGFVVAGATDSALILGITVNYFILSTIVLRSVSTLSTPVSASRLG